MNLKFARCLAVLVFLTGTVAAAEDPSAPAPLPAATGGLQVATFAGGCFWCMEPPFDQLSGVVATTSGYVGGDRENPTYDQVSNEETGHAEAVQILFDPAVVPYAKLLEVFWHNIDPTALDFQFCDIGPQYRSEIFYHDEAQRQAALASREALHHDKPFAGAVVTRISRAGTFYPAENYHQDYYKKNPVRYKFYHYNCGRDARLKELWGDAP